VWGSPANRQPPTVNRQPPTANPPKTLGVERGGEEQERGGGFHASQRRCAPGVAASAERRIYARREMRPICSSIRAMTENKQTVERYMEGFRRGDHESILSCLTEDVVWILPGAFELRGKTEFDGEIENEAFTGHPEITVTRMTEEDGVVVAEGTVRAQRKDGASLLLAMCDVFEMEGGKIRKLTSYLAELK
jgi:ketosteroid isomerase-like protein